MPERRICSSPSRCTIAASFRSLSRLLNDRSPRLALFAIPVAQRRPVALEHLSHSPSDRISFKLNLSGLLARDVYCSMVLRNVALKRQVQCHFRPRKFCRIRPLKLPSQTSPIARFYQIPVCRRSVNVPCVFRYTHIKTRLPSRSST
jgi:hypothetical protein